MPSSLAASYGAAALIQGLTALTLVREAHAVQRNEWVLVHAAAGGTGLWLCQVLRHIGARVIGTASTKEKIELAKQHGAAWMVNYKDESFVERVNEITGGEGVGVVFDGVGKDTFEGDFDVLAPKGSLVSFGNASGDVPPFQIRYVSLWIRARPDLFHIFGPSIPSSSFALSCHMTPPLSTNSLLFSINSLDTSPLSSPFISSLSLIPTAVTHLAPEFPPLLRPCSSLIRFLL